MEENVRISVRELVAFSYFQPDILPSADASALLAGTRAHQARQKKSEGDIEKSISHLFMVEGVSILVHGRMDAFADGEIPLVEEIKLGGGAMRAPLKEHRAQVMCYAAMLSLEKPCDAVRFCLSYVSESGDVLCRFEECMQANELRVEMEALLRPFAICAKRELAHRAKRDESLRAMTFPFDSYRKGQRELAAQVYTGIVRQKRLFASLPTGTGKSAAVLFPALKAMGEGKTEKVLYLTARNTARQSPLNALEKMRARGMKARCCVLLSKEKLCPAPVRCHPDECPRAGGHFIRQREAVDELLSSGVSLWDETVITELANRHNICPFELSLALTEMADVVMMDLNHMFDPFAQIKRICQRRSHYTLLVDEAHHAVERVRESLSGALDSGELARIRTAYGKQYGRKNPMYRSMGELIRGLRTMERSPSVVPEKITKQVDQSLEAAFDHAGQAGVQDWIRICLAFRYAHEHFDDSYAILSETRGKERRVELLCLLPGAEIARVSKGMRGAVFFSATLSPLPMMRQLLGGSDQDACFALPSPFPSENLTVIRKRICTRYVQRDKTVQALADTVYETVSLRRGNYILYFPSYAYLHLVLDQLDRSRLPELWIQTPEMNEEDRAAFLKAFDQTVQPRLGLCVLGGLFSEGIDLPGDRLLGVMIVGVGMPVPSPHLEAIRACYDRQFGYGFEYAYRIPGMQKVLQAAGRVIRSETDRGVVALIDDRYFLPDYEALFPQEWQIINEESRNAGMEAKK